MDREELKTHLCVNDPRSPYYQAHEERNSNCSCDMCFHGKANLAEYALELQSELADLKKHLQSIHSLADLRDLKGETFCN